LTRPIFKLVFATAMLTAVSVVFCATASAHFYYKTDTVPAQKNDTLILKKDSLRFPITDRRGDFLTNPSNNPFDLRDPRNIRDSIVYDPKTQQYYIIEKVGGKYYRKPTYLTFDELMRIEGQRDEDDYFRKRADVLDALNRKKLQPKYAITDNLFNRLFGTGKIDIKPQGNVDITAGYQGQNVANPTLPEIARKTGGFDFNESANINVVGNIGSKLKLPISYNTQSNFNFMNQLKLDYTGGADDIVKKIEAGNTSFTTKSTLISSAQSLFGVKLQLQFGKLTVTGVLANQTSQSQSLGLQGGAATTNYQFKADDYDENRNFLLAQYFKNNYNKAMSNLPIVNSQVQILHMEVWITNRNGTTTQARQVVGLMDLGENAPYNGNVHTQSLSPLPFNNANDEYNKIVSNPNSRNPSSATNVLNSLGLNQVQDFEIVYAKKLDSSAYQYNPQIGFITLSQTLQPDDVLGVAYQYSYNGKIYQVGEFSQDVPPDTATGNYAGTSKVLYLKLLKATAQRTNLPIWNLMMKNVYTLKTSSGSPLYNIQSTGFQLNILFDEPSKGDKRYLPEGDKAGVPLLSVLNLDRLNSHNDPQPDGIFDYIEGFTIVSQQARVIFPVLQPFGKDLDSIAFKNSQPLAPKYIFQQLYDTIKAVASTFANVDRYYLSGTAKGQASSDIPLGALNVPPGSVIVTAGGQTLRENVDYVVDYNLGSVKVINQAIINSGVPVNVKFENNASFGTQQRSFMGLRLDYLAKNTVKESLSFGGTIERLSERPYFTKTNYGEDPIKNTMYGLDFNYRSQLPGLTRLLNRLPFYSTKEMSSITAYGETAFLKPGHASQIGKGNSGTIYIDDFEGSTSSIDLRFPLTSWAIASVPQSNNPLSGGLLFPEAAFNDSLISGYNRAKIAFYNIDPTLQDNSNSNNPVKGYQNFGDPRISAVNIQQLFPQQTPQYGQAQLVTFDIAYYPTDKGPYNFDVSPVPGFSRGIAPSGKLNNPETRWGGIMRAIDQTDFETNNIQYIEFWMQSPFLLNPNSKGGQMYIDLGSVSEDILKDGKRLYENGLPTPNIAAATDTSAWGKVPLNPTQVTNAFSNDPSDRPYQDVGFDGLTDDSERVQFKNYLNRLQIAFPQYYTTALADPSGDNFLNYRDATYDASQADILARYKNINSPQGNSPVATTGQQYVSAFTQYPDQEDLDHDNTLNTLESYFEYKINLRPDTSLSVGHNFVTDSTSFTASGSTILQKWYQFRIPISAYSQNIGNIPDFKSIRFIRMFFAGFSDTVPIVCRFAEFQLIRDSWRSFSYVLDTTGTYTPLPTTTPTTFNVTAVNLEQNSSRTPIPYVIPPGIARQQQLSTNNVNVLLNEQSLSIQVCNLVPGDARGVYKTVNLDLRNYGHMDMFIHLEQANADNGSLNTNDMYGVIRIGSDFISNFYEIRIPLQKTPWGTTLDADIWPDSNNLNLTLNRLIQLKEARNNLVPSTQYYSQTDPSGRIYSIIGNPNLGQIQAIFLGVRNERQTGSVCAEVWFDELRLSEINDRGGWAALGRVDVKLADLGTMYLSGSYKSIGFGSIDQHINERSLDNITQINAATSLELGKLLPKKAAISIPTYASISNTTSAPEYDPFDLDIKLADKLRNAPAKQRDSIRQQAIDATTITTLNFTNIRKLNTTGKKLKLWSLENFDLSYSYTNSEHHNPIAVEDQLLNYKGGLGYSYSTPPKPWEPFKKRIKSKSLWYSLIKDFNINPLPSVLSFREDVNRQFGAYRSRNIGSDFLLPETFNKFFNIRRSYVLRWDLARSLNIDFSAINNSVVDEDSGRLDKSGKKHMWDNFWKGGRNVFYQQTTNITYTLPTNKLPVLDWTTIRVGYGATYSWTAASLLAVSLGNTLQNTQTRNAVGELDFTRLYNKSKWLRAIDMQPKNAAQSGQNKNVQNNIPKNKSDTARNKSQQLKNPNELPEVNGILKVLGRIITSVKRVNINYSENSASTIYGYTDSTRAMGLDLKNGEPGLGYVFGKQPGSDFVEKLARKGLISPDSTLNFQNQQSYNQKFTITAQVQPFRDFNIDVNLDKTFGKTYTELFKDTTSNSGFVHLNPYNAGTFSISFISLKTLFQTNKPDELSAAFEKFENYRTILSGRLGKMNPYSGVQGADGYYKGYGQYAQDVLIPAFIAAYTGKNPNTISLLNENNSGIRSNPFSGYLPKPNWRISYNGLARIPGFDKIFTSFNLTHAYNSTLAMSSFTSSLLYQDPLGIRYPGFIDTTGGANNFIPYFAVPNITITEAFSPLLNIDMQFVNKLQARIGYSKSRQLSLSLIDYQLTESRSTEFTFGGGWKKKGLPLPFKIKMPGKSEASKKLDNEINFRLDFSIRDDITSNSILDQGNALPTGGQKTVTISPSIDYVMSNRINLKLYFDQRRVTPKISTSPPIITTRIGLQIRISLAP
jgi:cell surface protein SprA